MTTQEFSDQFDTLLDSHKFKDEFGKVDNHLRLKLDEYEKSVLLTEAQYSLLKNNFQHSFDNSEIGQIYFSNLVRVGEGVPNNNLTPYAPNGKMFNLPEDLFWTINERVKDENGLLYTVKPINYTEYDRISSKPYAKPLKRQAWRLFQGADDNAESPRSEIVLRNNSNISSYIVRYIKKPRPIVLEDLGTLSVRGESNVSECEVNSIAHFDILAHAVSLALSRYPQGNVDTSNVENE